MSEWIEHDGKGMPVDGEVIVDVKFPDGVVVSELRAKHWHHAYTDASNWYRPDWDHHTNARISAYRIVEATP